MSVIGESFKICNVLGAIVIFLFCAYNISLLRVVTADEITEPKGKGNALTLVESPDSETGSSSDKNDDDDGIVTEVTNNEYVDKDSQELFEPTTEWKTVKKGQKIPPGLHVRMSMQTGEKEAKLIDNPKTTKRNQWYAGEDMGTINTEKQRFSRDELKKALKDFKLEEPTGSKEKDPKAEKFRSYDELKEAMKGMKMSVKTEAEIVTELLNKLKEPEINDADVNTILVDLEYYLHQIDNGRLFCDQGGMAVMMKLMNSSQEDIRSGVCLVLGSALQSNAKVQVNALESGVLQQLLRMISTESSSAVRKKCLYALSTLLRQFPYAQKQFLNSGGLSAVTEMFSKSDTEQVKVKVVSLLTDLVQESESLAAKNEEPQKEKTRQYSEVNMRGALQRSGWCVQFSSLLHRDSGHDNVEKVISAMTVLKDTCREQFSPLRQILESLSREYSALARADEEQGETDTLFHDIHHSIENLLDGIRAKRVEL